MRRGKTSKLTGKTPKAKTVKSLGSVGDGRRVLQIEARAVQALIKRIDKAFAKAVDLLAECRGKVVVSGMGKSGLVGQKIAATLASTGTSSFFLHPAEGVHGDLGMLARRDALIAISNSGETQELLQLLPYVERMGIPIVSLTGRMTSTLAKNSDVALDVSVDEEACPMGLAPTASTTATLALGDALAVALLQKRGFK
jgi:arabinose-5-phosphate isomerase